MMLQRFAAAQDFRTGLKILKCSVLQALEQAAVLRCAKGLTGAINGATAAADASLHYSANVQNLKHASGVDRVYLKRHAFPPFLS
jgi:hypothetical protein